MMTANNMFKENFCAFLYDIECKLMFLSLRIWQDFAVANIISADLVLTTAQRHRDSTLSYIARNKE